MYELDLCNYATKADLKEARGVNTSNLTAKSGLGRLKDQVDKMGIDKLKTVPAALSNLTNIVDNDVVKKTVYNELNRKINAVDRRKLV